MRKIRFAALLGIALFSMTGKSFAYAITVQYTGTYTGSWFGNYDPNNPGFLPSGVGSGQFGPGSFSLSFSFDTSLASPGFFGTSYLGTNTAGFPIGTIGDPVPTSVGSATFVGSDSIHINTGGYSASDSASAGSATQYADGLTFSRYVEDPGILSPIIQITAFSPSIPSSILASYDITHGLSGAGTISLVYEDTILGSGMEELDLVPTTLDVSVSPPVPEPSTWAMLILGFIGIWFAGYRKRQKPYRVC